MSGAAGGKGPLLIAVTGGMGSGKSTVSRFWAAFMGLPLVDIDAVCRQLLAREMPGWHALRSLLPEGYFIAGGDLDRGRLRAALFADAELRRQVNGLVHPLARERMLEMTGQLAGAMVLVDVPLLFEAGWQAQFAHSVVVYAAPAVCCRRLVARDRIAPEEALRSMAAQMALADKALLADHVIDNSGCRLFTRLQAAHLGRLLSSALAADGFLQESP